MHRYTKQTRKNVVDTTFKEELTYKILVSSAKWCTDENIVALGCEYILETVKSLILSLGACQTQYLKVQTVCC